MEIACMHQIYPRKREICFIDYLCWHPWLGALCGYKVGATLDGILSHDFSHLICILRFNEVSIHIFNAKAPKSPS